MLCVLGNIPEIPLESSTGNTIDERDVTSCVCGSLKTLSFSLAWSFHRLFSILCDPWSSLEGSAAPDGMCEGGSESEIRCDRHSVVETLRSVQMSVWYGRSDACWRNTIRRPLTVSHCLYSSSFVCRLAWHTTELTQTRNDTDPVRMCFIIWFFHCGDAQTDLVLCRSVLRQCVDECTPAVFDLFD